MADDAATVSPGSARKQKKRERERIRFATMSIEKRTERNTKQRERYNITKSAGLSVGFNYKFIILGKMYVFNFSSIKQLFIFFPKNNTHLSFPSIKQ